MKISWISDPHLEFLDYGRAERFMRELRTKGMPLLITGDITTATMAHVHWEMLTELVLPIWYVLGNHDYFNGSIDQVRGEARKREQTQPRIRWMSGKSYELTAST
jgi:predicted phosphodiesterase